VPASLLDVNVWVAAAFAISSSTRMVTLDQDFRQFLGAGLELELLQADRHGGG
jgi:predicted nucleic acid-binding protein